MQNKNFNRFIIKAQEALQSAQDLASKNHGEFRALHLLSSLISDSQSLVQPLLTRSNVNLESLDNTIEEELKKLPKIFYRHQYRPALSFAGIDAGPGQGRKIAQAQKDEFISCEHLLLGILKPLQRRADSTGKSGFKRDAALHALAQLRGSTRVTDETPESKFQVLDKYAVNLTDKARDGKLDPVIGRDEELRRVIQCAVPQDEK